MTWNVTSCIGWQSTLYLRSLIEWNAARCTQQPVVMEYVTEHLIDQVCQEILSGEFVIFKSHALLKAQAPDYIRDIQRRLIVQPVIERLTHRLRSPRNVSQHFKQLLSTQREQAPLEPGYVGGNSVNLLRVLNPDLSCYDFSHLTLWQADLREIELHQTNFSLMEIRTEQTEVPPAVATVEFTANLNRG